MPVSNRIVQQLSREVLRKMWVALSVALQDGSLASKGNSPSAKRLSFGRLHKSEIHHNLFEESITMFKIES